jgi:hypothetical protein
VNFEKQFDWLVTNTDDITTQSHSLFACLRKKNQIAEWKTGLRWMPCLQGNVRSSKH